MLRKELHLSSPATTALIDRLYRSGHVVRERQGTDRRQVQLRMTPKAYRDGSAMFLPLARHMGAAMAEFTPEELEIATRFMNSMIDATVRAGQEASGESPVERDGGTVRIPSPFGAGGVAFHYECAAA